MVSQIPQKEEFVDNKSHTLNNKKVIEGHRSNSNSGGGGGVTVNSHMKLLLSLEQKFEISKHHLQHERLTNLQIS